MAKHYNGKHLIKNVIHNGITFRMMVVKGNKPEHVPEDPEDKADGSTIHFNLARTSREFDENLIEVLNSVGDGERVLSLCSTDDAYEYGYTRLKEISAVK